MKTRLRFAGAVHTTGNGIPGFMVLSTAVERPQFTLTDRGVSIMANTSGRKIASPGEMPVSARYDIIPTG
jgi:hypothetical protein